MYSLKKQKGFTIVELLIVIIIIGILATLVIVTFTGIQKKARDSKRQTDIGAVESHLKAFYAQKGYYPSNADINNSTWVSSNLQGLDPAALKDPKYDTGTTVQNGAGDTKHYGYAPLNDSSASCETDDTTCSSFTLTATLENGGTFVRKSN